MSISPEEPTTARELAQDKIARGLAAMLSEMDELVAMAADPTTVDLIESEKIAIGQILNRAQLIISFLSTSKPAPLRVVR